MKLKCYILITRSKYLHVTCAVIGVYVLWLGFTVENFGNRSRPTALSSQRKHGQFICCRILSLLDLVFPGIHFWEIKVPFKC